MIRSIATRTLAIAVGDGVTLPTEFRLFVSGWNPTEKGSFLFDQESAASVMAAFEAHNVDLMIDLEHQGLDAASSDPTARDARGWCRLEVRDDGSLWAIGVTWTPDGVARLTEKRQRYVSPAFEIDPASKRVTKIINVAITAIPATHDTPALVAARAVRASFAGEGMDPKLIAEALDALIAGDTQKCMDLLKGLIAGAAGAEPAPESVDPPADTTVANASVGNATDEDQAAVAASISRLTRLTDRTSVTAALDVIEAWRASHIRLEAETQRLAKERYALELASRKENAITLTKLGAETPHTTGLASGKLCKRLLDEPLDEQNARVAALLASRGGKLPGEPRTPAGSGPIEEIDGSKTFQTPSGSVTLSASELYECQRAGAKPEVYAANKAKRLTPRGK